MKDLSRIRATEPSQPRGVVQLSLAVLGSLTVSVGTHPVRIASRKSRALLGYLALSDAPEQTRERLVGLFWSESDEEKARASLRQAVRDLREAFADVGFDGLVAEKQSIALDRSRLHLDLADIIAELDAGRIHPRLLEKRLSEALLEGLDNLDPAFRIWLLTKRQSLHDHLARSLEDRLRSSTGARSQIDSVAAALLNLDPTHEEACRHLIKSRADVGDIAGALRIYKELWDLLDAEYDIEPSPPTQDLIVEIKQGMYVAKPAAQPRATPANADEPAVPAGAKDAALPAATIEARAFPHKFIVSVDAFDVSGVNLYRTEVIQGFRHELIACLIRFREWHVRDSAQKTPENAPTAPSGVAEYCVEASAVQVEGGIRLIMTLREAGSEVYVWSDRYQITVGNWADTQQAIVRRIAIALNVHLSAERLRRFAGQPSVSRDIYDRWLRGQAIFLSFNSAKWPEAGEIFAGIIEEAPGFSPAFSGLAQINNLEHIVFPGVYRNRARERRSLELARAAVQLDPMDSRAHLCLAWSLIMAKHYAQAAGPVSHACELNENDPWTLLSAAHILAFCASFDRARELARQTLELSHSASGGHWGYLARIAFLLGDYEECLAAAINAETILSGVPGDAPKHRLDDSAWVAAALFHVGRTDEAAEEAQRFLTLVRDNWRGETKPTDATIMQWLLHLYPIRRREDWERLRDGLRGAGVPVDGMDHHAW